MADKKHFSTIDEYIDSFPKDIQSILQEIRKTIHDTAPECTESISYNMPTFDMNGKYLVYFAAWKKHIGFYPMPSGDKALEGELAGYKAAKSSVNFPLNKPMPHDLIRKIVLHQVMVK